MSPAVQTVPRSAETIRPSVRCGARHRCPLSASEEARLAARVTRGEEDAKREMIERNVGLVFALARSYRGFSVPFEDLVQEGSIGLIRAVERFDHTRGVRFSSYASYWIRRSLLDALGAAQTIRIPPHAAQQIAAVRRAEEELARDGMPSAPTQAIADRCGLNGASVDALRGAARVSASLDEAVGGEEARSLGEMIGDPAGVEPEERLAERERRRYAWELLKMLPPRHRLVLIRRYGVGGGRPRSHREIGASFGVKEERSRQLEREALHRLRELAKAGRLVADPPETRAAPCAAGNRGGRSARR